MPNRYPPTRKFPCSVDAFDLAIRIYQKYGVRSWTTIRIKQDGLIDRDLNAAGLLQNMRAARLIENTNGKFRASSHNSRDPTKWQVTAFFHQYMIENGIRYTEKRV